MTKIDIFSGFLGAGKTTLIKKLLTEAFAGEKVVLIENEFGDIGIDGGFLKDSGIQINEINSGCICCSLVGDFTKALSKVIEEYSPERILIEPSGVGKLSDVIRAASEAAGDRAVLNSASTVVDAGKCKMYMKNFGEFFNDQIENASAIILSHTDTAKQSKIEEAVELIRLHNSEAVIVVTPWSELDGKSILSAMEKADTLEDAIKHLEAEHHHHHDEDCDCGCHEHHHGEDCDCGCHEHHHDEDCDCGCHERHHDEDCDCGCHEHHHDEDCDCGCHEHHHDEDCYCGCHEHHHHHADEVFTSFGAETAKKFSSDSIYAILKSFDESSDYGTVLRAKGIVAGENGEWIHFDYVPGEADVRLGSAGIIGRICVIGSGIDNGKIKELFGL